MTQLQQSENRKKLLKGLLTAVLLLSMLSFSGYSLDSARYREVTKIEIVSANRAAKKVAQFESDFAPHQNNFAVQLSSRDISAILLIKAQFVKIEFEDNSKRLLSIKPTSHFLSIKFIPQNSMEDRFNSTRG
ncbi:MAG: hypothetical protein JJE09_06465 [Bacteroidia bacterium]|nr:hypothetical protein [Bacteroidia bacterium]